MRAGRRREGRDRARWRARSRDQQDQRPRPASDPYQEIAAFIDAQAWESAELAAIESLNLTSYLRDTSHIDLAPTERLRMLAVALETVMSICEQPRGWLALERIYAAGRALDPDDAEIEVSRAITSEACASLVPDRPGVARRMISTGRDAAERAIALRPGDARPRHALGMLEYSFGDGSLEAALACFEKAVQLEPGHGWARLYRAHCLHDLERWAEAARAYSEVAPAFLVGPIAWRYDLLREQRAWCLLQAGEREQALAEFLALLQRYELQPALAREQALRELTAAAEGPLHAELSGRLAQLRRMIETADSPDGSARA